MSRVLAGERFSTEISLIPGIVSEFALLSGDNNPIHHDAEFTANTRIRRPIVSGTHTTAG